MSELENNLIEKVKILILYGDRPVDVKDKEGKVERIFKEDDDIVFAENTSFPNYKTGIFYMPKEITEKQKKSLATLQKQLGKEDYNFLVFMNLHRDEDGILTGNQKHGSAKVLDEFVKEEEQR